MQAVRKGERQVNRQERADQLEATIAGAIADIEAEMLQGHSDTFLKSLEWWSQFRSYSWNNSILILLQRPDAIQVAGYRAWEKLGYHVKRGEEAVWIRGPWMRKEPDPETGELTQRLIGYIPLTVFDISQTAEWPQKQPPSPYMPASDADWEFLYTCFSRRMETIYQIPVKELSMGGLQGGATSGKTIWVNANNEISVKVMTTIHECCHIAARHHAENRERWSLKEREMQVVAATYVLCRMLGSHNPNAAEYLLTYQVQPGELQQHLEVIGQIVREVRVMLNFSELGKEPSTQADEAA